MWLETQEGVLVCLENGIKISAVQTNRGYSVILETRDSRFSLAVYRDMETAKKQIEKFAKKITRMGDKVFKFEEEKENG